MRQPVKYKYQFRIFTQTHMSDLDKKDFRRQKFLDKNLKKQQVSEEQKFIAKNKKQLKRKKEDMKADELWEDWENEIY